MKIIDKYIIKKNLIYLISSTITIFMFILIINFFERINMLSKKSLNLSEIIKYTLFTSPFYLYLLMPLVSLISFLLLLNYFKTSSEYKAIYSSTYPPYIFLKNMLTVALAVSIFLVFFDKYSTHLYSNIKRKIIFNEVINFKINSTLLHAKLVDKYNLQSVYIDNELNSKLYSEEIKWDKNSKKWIAKNVYKIREKDGKLIIEKYKNLNLDTIPPPDNFIIEELSDHNSYSILELISRINKLKSLSLNTNQEEGIIFFRIGIILINIVSVFLAFIIFKTPLINNKGYAITASVISSIFIWFFITIFKRASDIETIPPYTTAFIPHFITLLLIFYFNKKINRVF